jgi:hypothetical protein
MGEELLSFSKKKKKVAGAMAASPFFFPGCTHLA